MVQTNAEVLKSLRIEFVLESRILNPRINMHSIVRVYKCYERVCVCVWYRTYWAFFTKTLFNFVYRQILENFKWKNCLAFTGFTRQHPYCKRWNELKTAAVRRHYATTTTIHQITFAVSLNLGGFSSSSSLFFSGASSQF